MKFTTNSNLIYLIENCHLSYLPVELVMQTNSNEKHCVWKWIWSKVTDSLQSLSAEHTCMNQPFDTYRIDPFLVFFFLAFPHPEDANIWNKPLVHPAYYCPLWLAATRALSVDTVRSFCTQNRSLCLWTLALAQVVLLWLAFLDLCVPPLDHICLLQTLLSVTLPGQS